MNTIADFKNIQQQDLEFLYSKFRNKCLSYLANKFNHSLEERKDIYHDALLAVYSNITNNKIKDWNGPIEGYLFGIVHNKSMEKVRLKEKKTKLNKDQALIDLIFDKDIPFAKKNEYKLGKVAQCLEILKDPCKTLINLYYLEEKSYDEICQIMNYANTDTAKSKKSKCMKRLRKLMKEHIGSGSIQKS